MRATLWLMLAGALFVGVGCAKGHKPAPSPGAPIGSSANPSAPVGRVALVNPPGQYAVLKFPLGMMAAPGQKLVVYRNGVKVAELVVTGPQRGQNTVADITSGDCRPLDEVRFQ